MENIRIQPDSEDYENMPYLDDILDEVETFVASKINNTMQWKSKY